MAYRNIERSRNRGAQNPQKFCLILSPYVGKRFREYCSRNNFIMTAVIENAVVDYLIKVKEIESLEALEVEEQMLR